MTDAPDLARRVERLEAELERLTREIADLEGNGGPVETLGHIDLTGPTPTPSAPPAPAPEKPKPPRRSQGPQRWVGLAGGVLFFCGMIFVYRFSVEQGYLTPFMRVVVGYGVGAALLMGGIAVRPRARWYGVLLEGTGLALLYATSYAATFFYQLVTRDLAFALMDLVSLVAVTASVRQKEQAIAVAGVVGAFATPVLLGSLTPDLENLALYSAGIALVASLVHYRTGWVATLAIASVGAWSYVAFCAVVWEKSSVIAPPSPLIQLALTTLPLILWGGPLWRRITGDPLRFPAWLGLAAITNSFALLTFTAVLRDWDTGATAVACIPLAALLFGAAWRLAQTDKAETEMSFHLAGGHLMTLLALALGADAVTDQPIWGSALWALYAAGLVWSGVRIQRRPMVNGGLAILAFTALKLIMLDFSEGSVLTRAVVFLGVGALALALNYWLLPHLKDDE